MTASVPLLFWKVKTFRTGYIFLLEGTQSTGMEFHNVIVKLDSRLKDPYRRVIDPKALAELFIGPINETFSDSLNKIHLQKLMSATYWEIFLLQYSSYAMANPLAFLKTRAERLERSIERMMNDTDGNLMLRELENETLLNSDLID